MIDSTNKTIKEEKEMSKEKREKDSPTEEKFIVKGAIELAPESKQLLYQHIREEITEPLASGDNFSSDEVVDFLHHFSNYTLLVIIDEAVSNVIKNTDPDDLCFADDITYLKKLKALKAVLDLR